MSDQPGGSSGDHRQEDALLAALRSAASRVDPVPPRVLEAAYDALTWRRIDAELAALVEDSAEVGAVAGVRGGASPRLLTFEADAAGVEVEVHESADARRVVGQVVPPRAATIEIRHASGTTEPMGVDELGRFVAEVPRGPVSVRVLLDDGRAVDTEWTAI